MVVSPALHHPSEHHFEGWRKEMGKKCNPTPPRILFQAVNRPPSLALSNNLFSTAAAGSFFTRIFDEFEFGSFFASSRASLRLLPRDAGLPDMFCCMFVWLHFYSTSCVILCGKPGNVEERL
jgi:hypothetical protein